MNFGITAAYSLLGSCRGPNTLKYRRPTVSTPKSRCHTEPYSSPATLLAAYGEIGAVGWSSRLGSIGLSPYTDDDEA